MPNKEDIRDKKEIENKQLQLIPKIEDYIEYMLNVIVKLPRTERFNIGNNYKLSLYAMLNDTLYLNKINRKEHQKECFVIVNRIDVELTCQRIYLRIMKKQMWIDKERFNIIMRKIYEIGKIIGGLTKVYAEDN